MKRLFLVAAVLFACGKDNAGNADQGFGSVVTLELTQKGPNPDFLEIIADGKLTVVNHDSAAHQLTSSDCPDLPFTRLAAGASQTITATDGPRSCGYTDALGATWSGRIQIVSRPRGDGGIGGY